MKRIALALILAISGVAFGAITQAEVEAALKKIDGQAVDGLAGVNNSLAYKVHEIEKHFHNRESWVGISGSQTGGDWSDSISDATMIPVFVAISGDDTYGADANDEAWVIGTNDLPLITGMVKADIHEVFVTAASVQTIYWMRIVYGSGTMADAITAGQYSEYPIIADAAVGGSVAAVARIMMPRITSGTDKIWIQAKSTTDNATLSFYIGLHEYTN